MGTCKPQLYLSCVLCVILGAGCAAGFTSSTVEDFGSFRVDVTNDLAPRVEVYLQVDPGEGGGAASETLLGSAPVEGTTVFRIEVENPSTPHRLRAVFPRNREVFSESFVPAELQGIRWELADNALDREPRGPVAAGGDRMDGTPGGTVGPDHRRPTGARIIPPGS